VSLSWDNRLSQHVGGPAFYQAVGIWLECTESRLGILRNGVNREKLISRSQIVRTGIMGELPQMRRDTVSLVRQSVADNRRAYVLVNNRSEGNAPLTVSALVGLLKA